MVLRFGFYSGDIFFLSFISSCMIQYSYLIMFVYWVSLCACECPFSFHSLDSSLSLYIQVIGVEYPVRSVDVLYDFVMILRHDHLLFVVSCYLHDVTNEYDGGDYNTSYPKTKTMIQRV